MDISELLKTDEAKAAIQAAVDDVTKGLKAKNEELLGSIKKEKDDRKALQDMIDEIKAEKEQAEAQAAEKSGDVEKIKENLKLQHQKELEKLQSQLSDKDSKLHSLLVDNGLTESLTKAGVAPQHLDVVKAYIKSQHKAEIAEVDGSIVAKLNDKPLGEFVSEWSQGDQGKHYVAAPNNAGGGANGANGGGKAAGDKTITRSQFDALDQGSRMAAAREGVKVVNE